MTDKERAALLRQAATLLREVSEFSMGPTQLEQVADQLDPPQAMIAPPEPVLTPYEQLVKDIARALQEKDAAGGVAWPRQIQNSEADARAAIDVVLKTVPKDKPYVIGASVHVSNYNAALADVRALLGGAKWNASTAANSTPLTKYEASWLGARRTKH
jgi:hypothetical protein